MKEPLKNSVKELLRSSEKVPSMSSVRELEERSGKVP